MCAARAAAAPRIMLLAYGQAFGPCKRKGHARENKLKQKTFAFSMSKMRTVGDCHSTLRIDQWRHDSTGKRLTTLCRGTTHLRVFSRTTHCHAHRARSRRCRKVRQRPHNAPGEMLTSTARRLQDEQLSRTAARHGGQVHREREGHGGTSARPRRGPDECSQPAGHAVWRAGGHGGCRQSQTSSQVKGPSCATAKYLRF